jgi:chemotaxis family two-component system response regulator Rcp1
MENKPPVPYRVLVVEDNPNDQELLRHQLRKTQLGNHILFLSDPRKALSLLTEPGSALLRQALVALFLDVNLPHMSGIDLLRQLRKVEGLDAIPVIVMTSSPHTETLAACKELDVAYVAEKPVTASQFSKVLADLFHQQQSTAA